MATVDILGELMAAIERREGVVMATVIDTRRSVPRRPGSKMLVFGDGRRIGTIGGGEMEARVVRQCLEVLDEQRPRRLSYALVDPTSGDPGVCGGEVELYLEPHMPTETVYIIGIGHVGQAVMELAAWLGYRVVAWDDRPELADPVDGVARVLSGSISEAIAAEPIDAHTRVVMVTRNVDLDVEILPAVLASPAAYVGLMGSQRRWDTTRAKLAELGVAPVDLARVQSPIGVEIGAETPSEIAVSIMAEVIGSQRDP